MLALEFPSIDEIVKWTPFFGDGQFYAFNKIALISLIAVVVPVALFLVAGAKGRSNLVPKGVQNVVEATVEFVEKNVVMQAIGPDGMRYLPLLLSIFCFVFVGNIFEVLPTSHMPANARMANPVVLAVIAWITFIAVGVKHNGPRYFKETLFPPGVPKALYLLVTPIEFISVFLIRPFSLAVRLFANMLAGHILLVTFSVLTIALWGLTPLIAVWPFSFLMLVAFTAFEIMVSFLQAYVFSLLTAVFIGGALHPAH